MHLTRRALRNSIGTSLPLLTGLTLWVGASLQGAPSTPDVILVPYLVEDVRALVPVDGGVLVYNPGTRFEAIELTSVRVSTAGHVLAEHALATTLPGEAEYGEIQALIERLPDELGHLHRAERWFAAVDAPSFSLSEGVDRLAEIQRRVAALRAKYAAGIAPPFAQPNFVVPLDQVFSPSAAPGTTAPVLIEIAWSAPDGARRTSSVERTLTWLGPRPGLPPTSSSALGGGNVFAGDLHVHSCHGEAAGACPPSTNCAAESLQTSGSFTYAQLKTQFQALGSTWFTATDHSYCINSDAEYAAIVAETAALTDASFVAIPDIELSSDEEGPQQGSDLGNTLCLGLTQANHMGAHGITSRKEGGGDGFLGFCNGLFNDVLEPFTANAAAIRAEGGYPIVNHPDASSFGWNSIEATRGIEANQMHGVEIWNGALQTGQGGNVAAWVDWLLAGRLLYAYGGSDTHDAAFDHGANHAILDGALGEASLESALRAGRVYVSNGPSLVIELDLGGATLGMGARHPLPTPAPADPVTARAHYDFGGGSGTVTIFRGVSGGAAETVVCQSAGLSGAGFVECADTLVGGATSWYRAYLQNDAGTRAAYTNPVFLVPGSEPVFSFCTGKLNTLGCTPSIGWSGSPSASAGSGFLITARDLIPNSFGLMIYGLAADYFPFQGATLCVGLPFVRTPIQNSGSMGAAPCRGLYSLDFNVRIASGVDPSLVAGVTVFAQYWQRDNAASFGSGLSNALQFTIGN